MEEIETEIEGNKDESETAFELNNFMISFWFQAHFNSDHPGPPSL